MPARKSEIITFKADESLLSALKGVENRSNFIRAAIMSALDSSCPLCGGRGVLSPNQMRHWRELDDDHSLEECEDCSEVRLVCSRRPSE
ncbi:MAG: CopG family transcriptional regulator [Candidatus Eisenbacteria bacterium]